MSAPQRHWAGTVLAVAATFVLLAVVVLGAASPRPSGVRVPQDVAVVGYGDTSVARSASVPLTTVRQPMSDLGRAAVDHLIRESEGMAESRMHHHSSTVFQPSLVVRESAPLPE